MKAFHYRLAIVECDVQLIWISFFFFFSGMVFLAGTKIQRLESQASWRALKIASGFYECPFSMY